MSTLSKRASRSNRVRATLKNNSDRPRLVINITNKQIYTQLINDFKSETLVSENSMKYNEGSLTEKSVMVAKNLAKKLKDANISQIKIDRGFRRYTGRVKTLVETLREEGIEV